MRTVLHNGDLKANKTTSEVCISRRLLKGKKYFFRDIPIFHFPLKSNMAAKSGEDFSPLYSRILYFPVVQKFAQKRSISYHFSRYSQFLTFR